VLLLPPVLLAAWCITAGAHNTRTCAAAARPRPLDLQCKSDNTKVAKSTTSAEFLLHLQAIIKEWAINRGEHSIPYLQYDNNKIQASADLSSIGLSPACRVPLSAYSPDLNRAIEHSFGWLKDEVRGWLYSWLQQHPNSVPSTKLLADTTHAIFMQRKQEWIEKDVLGLPQLWQVIDRDEGHRFRGSNGKWLTGSGGGWTDKTHS
jgi:hypothetical protein